MSRVEGEYILDDILYNTDDSRFCDSRLDPDTVSNYMKYCESR